LSLVLRVFAFVILAFAVRPLAAQPAFNGAYDGPSILGRGGASAGRRGSESVPIQVQASFNGTYDSSILGYSVDSGGGFKPGESTGIDATLSASGRHNWRRSFLGLDYGGNFSHYFGNTFFNGTNHQLNLGWGTQLGQRLQLTSQVGAGTSNRFLGGPSIFQGSEFEFLTAPVGELFDARNYFIGTTTSATYSFNRRQSVRFSGTGSTTRRRARSLVDMRSYGASADWVYRLSRRSSLGVSYSFSHFDFEKVFGESDVHTIGAHGSRRFGRDWELAASVTLSQQSTVGIRSFGLDPVLAAILGRNSGSEVFETNSRLVGGSVSLSRKIRRSFVSISAQRGVTPGNGFFLTSINEGVGASMSYNFSRDLSFNGNTGYNKMTSLGFASGAFTGWTAGGGVTYKLTESFGLNARYDWRTFDLRQTTFGRTANRVTIGITYFPQQGPAGLW
jgi:opacity protein-like surface antigen